jgi:hypothetical protein
MSDGGEAPAEEPVAPRRKPRSKTKTQKQVDLGWQPPFCKATQVDVAGENMWRVHVMDESIGSYLWRTSYTVFKDVKSNPPQVVAYKPEEWMGCAVGAMAQRQAKEEAETALEAIVAAAEAMPAMAEAADAAAAAEPAAVSEEAIQQWASQHGISIRSAKALASAARKAAQQLFKMLRNMFMIRLFRLPRLLNSTTGLAHGVESISDAVLEAGNTLRVELFGPDAEAAIKQEARSFAPSRPHAPILTHPHQG